MSPEQRLQELSPALRILHLIWSLDHSLMTSSKALQRTLGVTEGQLRVLSLLRASPGSSISDLRAVLQTHRTTIADVLARLERAGLISQRDDASHPRQRRFFLTKRGAAKAEEAPSALVLDRAVARLPADARENLESVIRALTEELRQATDKVRTQP